MSNTELPVIQKSYDLLMWIVKHTIKFPRDFKFSLADRMERQVYFLLEDLLRAKFTRERAIILEQVNLNLEIMRFQLRLARDFKCLSLTSYGFAAKEVNEIGQMVGGWLKQARRPAKEGEDKP